MIEVCITTTGNMYAKQELAIAFTTGASFMLIKVVHDGTLIEQEEIILAKKESKNWHGYKHVIHAHCLRCSCRTHHWMEFFGG